MKRRWTTEELVEQWAIDPNDERLLFRKEKKGRLGLVAQLAFYRRYRRFPELRSDFAPSVLAHLAEQIDVPVTDIDEYRWADRTARRHRERILERLGVRPFDKAARDAFRTWLMTDALPREPKGEALDEWINEWLARAKVERPTTVRFERLVRGARHAYEERVFQRVLARLDEGMRRRLEELLGDGGDGCAFHRLRGDPGRIGLDSLLEEVEKLRVIRELGLPADIVNPFHADLVKRYRRRAATEGAWDLRHQHPDRIRLALVTFYCVRRAAEIVDGLVELLVQITHRITRRAERRVEKDFAAAGALLVRGKTGILYRIAEAASEHPDGIVHEVIFPVASQETIEKLVKEYRASKGYDQEVYTVMRGSYGSYYRRMLPKLLAVLDLRSNNASHRPLLDAIAMIRSRRDEQGQYYKLSEVAVEGVIRPKWRDVVIEDGPDGEQACQPDQLRNMRPAEPSRAGPMQGDLGRRRRPLSATRTRICRATSQNVAPPATSGFGSRERRGFHREAPRRDDEGACAPRTRTTSEPACAPRSAPAEETDHRLEARAAPEHAEPGRL